MIRIVLHMKSRQPRVHLLAINRNGTIYTGVTSNLVKRGWEHRQHAVAGFTRKHGASTLAWYDAQERIESAIRREKVIKYWKLTRKIKVMESINPRWQDLYDDLLVLPPGFRHAP